MDDGKFDDAENDSSDFELGDTYYEEMPRERRHAVAKRAGGIATECCEKRCTLSYLKTFCCAALQLPGNSAGASGLSATTKSGGGSKSVAALLQATSKKPASRLPAMAFVSGGGDGAGEESAIDDLVVIR